MSEITLTLSKRITLLKQELPGQTDEAYILLAEQGFVEQQKEIFFTFCLVSGLFGTVIGLIIGSIMEHYRIINLITENAPQLLPEIVKIIH